MGLVVAALWYLPHRRAGSTTARPTPVRSPASSGATPRPASVAQICQTALQRADIVLIAALASPRDAAIYTAATRFMVIGQLGTQAVQQAMQPAVSRLLALDDREGTARVFAGCTTWTVALTWPVHLSVAVAAPIYLSAFGHGYGAGQSATVILGLAMLLATGTGPVDVMLLMGGRSGLSLANNAAALVVDLALNAAADPVAGHHRCRDRLGGRPGHPQRPPARAGSPDLRHDPGGRRPRPGRRLGPGLLRRPSAAGPPGVRHDRHAGGPDPRSRLLCRANCGPVAPASH